MSNREILERNLARNSQVLDVFSTEQLISAWEQTTGREFAKESAEYARFAANYASAVVDANTLRRMVGDLGANGRLYTKMVNGRQYIIFKGYSGLRSIFNASRYLATNPKVIDMAIGRLGALKSVASGARLTIFLVVPLNVINHILDDRSTMARLIGQTATDLMKVGIASVLAASAATAAAAVTTLAAGPLIVAVGVGLAVGFALDALDKHFGLTDKLVGAIEESFASVKQQARDVNRQYHRINRQIGIDALNGSTDTLRRLFGGY